MKKILVILLLLLVGGCGKNEQAQKQPTGDTIQNQQQPKEEQPSGDSEQEATAALKKLGVKVFKRDDDGNVSSVGLQLIIGGKITDAGLVHLKGLASLTELDLPKYITDAGLVHLKELKKLESLSLFYTKVTDAGLGHLKELTSLQSLRSVGLGHRSPTLDWCI